MATVTLPCAYIVKLPDLGWRQHKCAYHLVISFAREAWIVAPLPDTAATPAGAAPAIGPTQRWIRSAGACRVLPVGSRKLKIFHGEPEEMFVLSFEAAADASTAIAALTRVGAAVEVCVCRVCVCVCVCVCGGSVCGRYAQWGAQGAPCGGRPDDGAVAAHRRLRM